MPSDMSIIKQIEAETGRKLEEVEKLSGYRSEYVLDSTGNVRGLALAGARLDDWALLHRLNELTTLRLYDYGLTDASFIAQMENLTDLDLSSNQIADWGFMASLKGLTRLTLRDCGLTDASFLAQMENLTDLDLSNNEIADWGFMASLKGLTRLWLRDCGLTDASFITQMESLTDLDLSGNKIADWGFMASLKGLTRLRLSRCGLTNASFLAQMENLTDLDLSDNKIADWGFMISLKGLTRLRLWGCGLTDAAFIAQMENLTDLDLSDNKIADWGFMASLKGLTRLTLSNCGLTDASFLAQMENLTNVHLSDNQIADWGFMASLKGLTRLTLNSCGLTDASFLAQMEGITSLDLRKNMLRSIPKEFCDRGMNILWGYGPGMTSRYAVVEGNPLEDPPAEVVKSGPEAVRNYFRQVGEEGQDYLYEAKLLIVGEERAGKSSLTDALVDPSTALDHDRKSTHGIRIIPWTIPGEEIGLPRDFRLNVWDFGGQDIYHSTHQFFLTKRSLYLLITEARKEMRHEDFYWWLSIIRSLSKDCPVVIVLTKCDLPTVDLPIREYREVFPCIVDSQKVSCHKKHRSTLDCLKQAMAKILNDRSLLPDIGTPLPKSWVQVREALEELRGKKKTFITCDQYITLCKHHGLDEKQAMHLSDYYHDLGVFLHFRDDPALRNTIFLDHEWVTKAIYNVFDNKEVIAKGGVFTDADLTKIWKAKKFRNKQGELLALMRNERFEICFTFGAHRYLTPHLLPADMPEKLHGFEDPKSLEKPLHFEFQYQFMPKGLLARLIVRMHRDVYRETYWRYGVLLHHDETRALVREHYFDRKIAIIVTGAHKRELLSVIRYQIEEINAKFDGLAVEEMLPCNCAECRADIEAGGSPFYYKYSFVRIRQKKASTVVCGKSGDDVPIAELFGEVFLPREEDERSDKGMYFYKARFEGGSRPHFTEPG